MDTVSDRLLVIRVATKYIKFCFIVRVPSPGGVLGISSDGDDRMELKVKTQKNP